MSASETAAQLIYAPNVQANASLTTVKFYSACFSGAVAGILGLQNWLGFALFFASILFTTVCISFINCRGSPSKFVHGGMSDLVNPGTDNAAAFLLLWTLFFGAYLLHPTARPKP